MRRDRHQRHLLCETGEASASLWETEEASVSLCETGEASASLTLEDRRGISVTYFRRQKRHQRHLLCETKRHQRHITARLTFLIHSVRMRPNFQALPWLEFDGLGEDELLTRFLLS